MKRLATEFGLVGILSGIFGGALGAQPPAGQLRSEEGFVDIDLVITDVRKDPAGLVSVAARGKIDGSIVGVAVDIFPEWKEQKVKDVEAVFYWGKARYRSIGEDSDRFVRLLAKLYGIAPVPKSMSPRIEVAAVGLDNNPSQVLKVPVKMKFFFESEAQDRYAEVFTNIDIAGKRLEFYEKDPEYRVPLVRALTEGN